MALFAVHDGMQGGHCADVGRIRGKKALPAMEAHA